jgi:AraC-like DNA-binding protein
LSEDVLSTMLQSVRIAASLQFCLIASGEWQTDGKPRLGKNGGAVNCNVPFHIVADGGCWLRMEGCEEQLTKGDVVAFPFGTGHALGVGVNGPLITPTQDLPPKPWRNTPALHYGKGELSLRILCGYVTLDALNFAPLRQSLPPLLIARSLAPGASPILKMAVEQMIAEADSKSVGSVSMVERLTEVIMIELLRAEVEACRASAAGAISGTAPQLGANGGLLSAVVDDVLARCLAAIHAAPGRSWSVEQLARDSGVSRTVLMERFQSVLATSPMKYVRDWRLYLASVALRTSKRPISKIAEESGYGTESAFTRAFTRALGLPPARFRAANRLAA